jgi:hypothetical protein
VTSLRSAGILPALRIAAGGANALLVVSAFSRSERHLLVFIAVDPLRSQRHLIKNKTSSSSPAPRPDQSLRDEPFYLLGNISYSFMSGPSSRSNNDRGRATKRISPGTALFRLGDFLN